MNKGGCVLSGIILLLLLAMLGASLYYLYINLPAEEIKYTFGDKNINNNGVIENLVYDSSQQFYKNMRYKSNRISYKIESACDEKKAESIKDAFSILESKTILEFYPSDTPDIRILCSDIAPEAGQKNHFVAGEGGPSEILNTSLYSVILEGKISLFRDENCRDTKIAVHELLHALGFDHNNNPKSILYPTLNCEQTIDEDIISNINKLYTPASAPDLKIVYVNATKSGKYLNFYIEVINQGLQDASGVSLSIYSNDELATDYDLDEIDIGVKKILSVENLKISRSSEEISFVVDENNLVSEIFENNNRVELRLVEE